MKSSRGSAYRQAGFSLVEVLVTLSIIGAITLLYVAISSTYQLTRSAAYREIALRIASEEMNTLRAAGYGVLPGSGSFTDTQMANLPNGSGTLTVTTLNAKTKTIDVTVSWQEISAHSVSLSTYITETGGLK